MVFLRRSVGAAFISALLSATPLFAADVSLNFQLSTPAPSLQAAPGGAEAIIYQSDTTTLSSVVLGDGVMSSFDQPASKTSTSTTTTNPSSQNLTNASTVASLGFSTFFSPYLKVYSIPLSYTFFDDLRVTASIPYIQRTIKKRRSDETTNKDYTADGLGDVSMGLEYRWLNRDKLQLSTTIDMILPTGDVEAQGTNNGNKLTVPLGSGAFSTYLIQHATYRLSNDIKLFGNAGIRYYTDADYTAFPNVVTGDSTGLKVHEEKGMVFSGMIGSEYRFLEDFSVAGRLSIVNVMDGKQSVGGGPKMDSNDSITAGDFSATIKYQVLKNMGASLSAIVPVFTTYDPDVRDPEERTWGINFSISKFF